MKEVEVGDRAYVHTSWGLVSGKVVKIRTEKNSGVPQYKLDINVPNMVSTKGSIDLDYNFWYTADKLYKNKFVAIIKSL